MYPKDETPYGELYREVLEKNGIDYRVVYWNRDKNGENSFFEKEIYFNLKCANGGNKLKKIVKMLKYALFIRGKLKNNDYDKAIILTTVPGIFTFDILLLKYKDKYIYDIRDFTNENNILYYFLEKKIIQNSFQTVISSPGFKYFLPKEYTYKIAHNISNESDKIECNKEIFKNDKVVIGFVGNIRYEEENTQLIKGLNGYNKFSFEFWGKINKDFSKEKILKENPEILFHGPYTNVDKPFIYENIDFINAIYGNETLEVTTALPNRLYDALIFKKPILTSKGTYLGEIVEKNNIGIAVDFLNDDLYDVISNYIHKFNEVEFIDKCNELLSIYLDEQKELKRTIHNFATSTIIEMN